MTARAVVCLWLAIVAPACGPKAGPGDPQIASTGADESTSGPGGGATNAAPTGSGSADESGPGTGGAPAGSTGADGATTTGAAGSGATTGPHTTGPHTTTGGELETTAEVSSSGEVDTTTGPHFETCDELRAAFEAEVLKIRGCVENSECGQVLKGTSCGCTNDWVARLDADPTHFWELWALAAEANEECEILDPSTCGCRNADSFECRDGICDWDFAW